MTFERDFDWQSGLLPEVKRIVANYLIKEAPPEEDQLRNTDLIVLGLSTIRVACRLRDHSYIARYGDQFTIRSSRPSGARTELAKVLSGWGDYLFYGFATSDQGGLAAWLLGDLGVFRLWHHDMLWRGRPPGVGQENIDGSSSFRAYRITDLPPEFVIARMSAGDLPSIGDAP